MTSKKPERAFPVRDQARPSRKPTYLHDQASRKPTYLSDKASKKPTYLNNQASRKPASNERAFIVPSWLSDETGVTTGPPEDAVWRDKAGRLEAAKRKAAASFAKLRATPEPQLQASWNQDEIRVLQARVELLNSLMTAPKDPRLCVDNDRPPRICVMYNRMCCEGETEVGPMQSTMAWVVHNSEASVQQLLTAGEGGHETGLKDLLALVRATMPAKDNLHGLDAVLQRETPARLVLKSVAGVNAQPGHTRVAEGLTKNGAQYQLVWAALDLQGLEEWQNPSTNAAIRMSVLDAAHQAARDAARNKEAVWSTVNFMQIRICVGDECHVLSLTPFCDSDSCTVTHLQYAQSVFDDSGPERGILNLNKDPATIHAIPLGKALPMSAYVCLGAHKQSRLNEAQLNYVHSRGLLAHNFDTKLLPPATACRYESQALPPAKSTRISSTGLDVLASSYHIADKVFTTITVV
jgi:hypothetical protein